MTGTAGVSEAIIQEIQENLEPIFIVKIEVMSILTRNLCHYNCSRLLEILNKNKVRYEHVLGYNITACPCSGIWSLELHSVIRVIETGELFDLTTDFNQEKEKWFVGMKVLVKEDNIVRLCDMATKNRFCFVFNKDKHSCRKPKIDWFAPREKEVRVGELDKVREYWIFVRRMKFMYL
jgi:hypothetical protein